MKEKILLLGGAYSQIPAIKEAKHRGLYTILCDYLPDNPGQQFVDEFHLVSTTDKEKVLQLAKQKKIDYILAYCSDPAVYTSAYVASEMGLFGNKPDSIAILSYKDLFRKFLKENNFNAPDFRVIKGQKKIRVDEFQDLLPAVVKPVDSSDTKGVTLVEEQIELNNAIERAFNFTRCGRVIIEQKIDAEQADLHGDGFVIDGKLQFCELGDHIYRSVSDPLKPSSTLFPSKLNEKILKKVEDQIAKMIQKCGYKNGALNIEARIDSEGKIFIMEIGPRNGGGFIPQTIYHSTGFNMVQANVDLLMDKEIHIPKNEKSTCICFTLHVNETGFFESFQIHKDLKSFLVEKHLFIKPGDLVKPYKEPGSSLGALIFRFEDEKKVDMHLDNFYHKVVGGVQLKK